MWEIVDRLRLLQRRAQQASLTRRSRFGDSGTRPFAEVAAPKMKIPRSYSDSGVRAILVKVGSARAPAASVAARQPAFAPLSWLCAGIPSMRTALPLVRRAHSAAGVVGGPATNEILRPRACCRCGGGGCGCAVARNRGRLAAWNGLPASTHTHTQIHTHARARRRRRRRRPPVPVPRHPSPPPPRARLCW